MDDYDKCTFPGIHTEDGYDSMKDYEHSIMHHED